MSNEEEAQRAFCLREYGRLVGAMHLYTGDRDLACELAQEALARACRDWAKVSRLNAPGAWAYRVALNLARSHFRRRRAERRAQQRMAADRPPVGADHADAVALRGAIRSLPPRQRQALVLRYYVGLPVAETAVAMGCRDGTVRALTSQALGALRQTLDVESSQGAPDGH